MAMSMHRLPKALMISAGAIAFATLGGMGLSQYAMGDAFYFYKQSGGIEPQMWRSEAAQTGWTYSADAQPQRAEYPEHTTPPPLYLAEASPLPYDDRALYASYGYQSISSEPPSIDEAAYAEPTVRVMRGSWTEPAEPETSQTAPAQLSEAPPALKEAAEAVGDTATKPAPAAAEDAPEQQVEPTS